ncbi:hypothetical protein [Sedimentitalea sp.]|uniref:hypothetical protein n=1 Tax=Sedimentitalea sp. TaxID=2048915 RepID=UPI003298E00F
MGQTYSIFGAGPGGLYTAWRLLSSGKLQSSDTLNLYEWGTYDFTGEGKERQPAGRICTHHYIDDDSATYIEIGGMRFIEWDGTNTPTAKGHRLVTKTVNDVGLGPDVVNFLTVDDPLYFLRGQHFYQSDLVDNGGDVIAPYNTPGVNEASPDDLYSHISDLITGTTPLKDRTEQCAFYASGTLPSTFNSFVYNPGDVASNVGYWNVFYDQAGNEGFSYAADGGGYSSNVINWNAANAAVYNGEFAPGGAFKTINGGYSRLFVELYNKACEAAANSGARFSLHQGERLHSIWMYGDAIKFKLATADDPFSPSSGDAMDTDLAFLAMPPNAVDIVAQATRFENVPGRTDFLNNAQVANYLGSVIEQPSYKIAMFFEEPWWENTTYPPRLEATLNHQKTTENVFGPTITDLPLRQVYYFGDNALPNEEGEAIYGLLASYDDMRYITFWRGLELAVDERRDQAINRDFQPLEGGREGSPQMEQMLRLELAKLHYGDPDAANEIPMPKSTIFMDWGLNPFGAGYHAWAANYDITDVMQKIRSPAQLAGVADAKVFLIGSAFSNDQAWVEGAFCTAESVLVDYLQMDPLIDLSVYPPICGTRCG